KHISLATNFVYKKRGAQTANAINANLSGEYFLINAKLSYALVNKLNIFLATNNITNIQYSDLLGSNMPRRWSTAGFSLHF
ncbi:MAG: TonB-dependent receptor, partial [Ferruginibacter sp.]